MTWPEKVLYLESFFKTATLPSVYVDGCQTCTDVKKFVDNHFEVVKSHNNKTYLPYLYRLHLLKLHIENATTH